MSLTLTDARGWIRDYARNAGDFTEYPTIRLDRALAYIGVEFVKWAKVTRTNSTAALTHDSASVDTSAITGFRPEYLTGDPRAWVTVSGMFKAEVEIVDQAAIFERQLNCPQTTTPRSGLSKLAFLTNSIANPGATIYPTPDAAATYVLNLQWRPPFTSWTLGTATPDSVTFNITDEYLIPLLTLFISRVIQHNEPEHAYAADRDKEFMDYCQKCAGMANLGVNVIQAEPVGRWPRRLSMHPFQDWG